MHGSEAPSGECAASPTRSRACVTHDRGDVPHDDEPVVKTSQGIDVEAAAAEFVLD